MLMPRYIAKRQGNDYVLVRVDAPEVGARLGLTALGVALLAWGAPRRGLAPAIALVAGAAMAYQGATGKSILDWFAAKVEHDRMDEKLDAALENSFPASDPMGSTKTEAVSEAQDVPATTLGNG